MNRLIIIAALSLAVSLSATSREIYNSPAAAVSPGVIATDTLPSLFNAIDYHYRVEIPRNCSDASWSITLTYNDSSTTIIRAARVGSASDDALYGLPVSVSVSNFSADRLSANFTDYEIVKDIDPTVDAWSMTLTQNPEDNSAICSIGQRAPLLTFQIETEGLKYITASTESKLRLARLSMFASESDSLKSSFITSIDQLKIVLSDSHNTAEGLCRYLDRDTDLRKLNLGANYMLATVASPDGTIEILYLGHSGDASTNLHRWKPLMLKGRLIPTIFIGHYDLEWYDAFGSKIIYETSADIIDGAILKVNFPTQGGSVRFQKTPMNLSGPNL
ncbi:MAG: hypothetical protein K2K94_04365 [Muribaculaceae bacterium]|nr:hypothetical protein [Muribaculaceae bacterium]